MCMIASARNQKWILSINTPENYWPFNNMWCGSCGSRHNFGPSQKNHPNSTVSIE